MKQEKMRRKESEFEKLKREEALGCVFLKIDLVIDDNFQENTKTSRLLKEIRKICDKENLVEESIAEDNDHYEAWFWEYKLKEHFDFLTSERNKFNRKISTLKKATIKN